MHQIANELLLTRRLVESAPCEPYQMGLEGAGLEETAARKKKIVRKIQAKE